ncbi:MAG: hypothetical protein RPU34_17060 [Candidatus Sedimenticola sp. (ex Thyasira tokunagai)]
MHVMRQSKLLGLLAALAILLTVASRLIHLDADPPTGFIQSDIGFHIDEGYKTLSPRNLVRFGKQLTQENDQYDGWMKSSPATQWPYIWSLKAAGNTDLASARYVSIAYFSLFLLTAFALLVKYHGTSWAFLLVAILASDISLFHFSRTAIFEIAVTFFIYTGIALSFSQRSRSIYFSVATLLAVGLGASFLVKASAGIYLFPAIAFICINEVSERKKNIWFFLLVLNIIALFIFSTQSILPQRLYSGITFSPPINIFYNRIHELSPLIQLVAYLSIVLLLYCKGWKELKKNRYQISLVVIVVITPLLLGLFSYNPTRYYLPIIPAAVLITIEALVTWRSYPLKIEANGADIQTWLAIAFMCLPVAVCSQGFTIDYVIPYLPTPLNEDLRISVGMQKKLLPFITVALLMLAFSTRKSLGNLIHAAVVFGISVHLVMNATMQITTLRTPTFRSAEVISKLEQIVGDNEVVGGDWAPFFSAGTNIRALYMEKYFNGAEDILILKPSFFLHSHVPNDEINLELLEKNPLVAVGPATALGQYHQRPIHLYTLTYLD